MAGRKKSAAQTAQEKRILRLAEALVPRLKKAETLALKGGRWEIGYDFDRTPRLVWQFNTRNRDRFAVVPARQEIVGLAALRYGYAEKKLSEAVERLSSRSGGPH
jgi:hypothetical protein